MSGKDHPRIRGEHAAHGPEIRGRRGSSPHTRGARPCVPFCPGAPRIIPAYAGSTSSNARRMARGSGSSPHTRGAPSRGLSSRFRQGIIPAYAGSTSSIHTKGEVKRDHPRIRGEHTYGAKKIALRRGSSPHTRGAPLFSAALQLSKWIIPAYAGSTCRGATAGGSIRDHPRIRGEHRPRGFRSAPGPGSSPHTRGALPAVGLFLRVAGIIPAYAGSTPAPPRNHQLQPGSSPHTRGARELGLCVPGIGGIIPAYAGSTRLCGEAHDRRTDHPRIRGEHAALDVEGLAALGSSPHTRGAPVHFRRFSWLVWIIPAYAGSTVREICDADAHGDHPRIRGEHGAVMWGRQQTFGSSPHTRGARRRLAGRRRFLGIIPAYAGSTRSTRRSWLASADHPRIRGEHQHL